MRRLFPIVYWSIAVGILLSVALYVLSLRAATPPYATYAWASGHTGDYYGYVYMIRRGREGHILYHNPYTPSQTTDALVHPFFHMLGLVSRPFPVTPEFVFFLTRLGAFACVFWALYFFLEHTIQREETKVLAGVFVLTATSIWSWLSMGTQIITAMPTTYNDYFDMFNRYTRVPPHHIMAFACLLIVFALFGKTTIKRKDMITILLLTVAIGLLQPYLAFFLGIILGIHEVGTWLMTRRIPSKIWLSAGIIAVCLITLVVNAYALKLLAAPFVEVTQSTSGRYVSLMTYLTALGPLIVAGCLIFFSGTMMKRSSVQFLVLWAVVPILLFLLPEVANVTSTYRLLETYQQIPLGILAAMGIEGLVGRKAWFRVTVLVFMVLSFVYGVYPFWSLLRFNTTSVHPEHFNEYIPSGITDTFAYLNSSTPAESMVLAGENLSAMVPAFAHNRVLIGESSSSTQYSEKVADTVAFFNGSMPASHVMDFLRRYHIQYILYGMDSPSFENSPYVTMPNLTIVKQYTPIEIVAVR